MATALISQSSRTPWRNIASVCKNAAVFLDSNAAELLHWAGGLDMLGDCVGVYDVLTELSTVAKDFIATAPYCHVVIVVTSFLHGKIAERISRLLSDLQPLECHVFCSVSEGMHGEAFPVADSREPGEAPLSAGYSHYGEFQALMRKWINRESGVRASVSHIDLFHAEIFPGFLVIPSLHTLFPLMPSDISHLQTKLVEEGDLDTSLSDLASVHYALLPRQLQLAYKSVAIALNEFLETLDIREDIFSLGHTSRLIANQLAGLPEARARRKSAVQRASLMFLDCTLDLTASCSHPTDWLGEKVFSLPRLAPDSNDVSVSMTPVSAAVPGGVLPGCIAQPHSSSAQNLIRTIVCSRQKDVLMEISRCLLEALSQEGLPANHRGKMGKPSADLLRQFLEQFKSRSNAISSQREVLQLGCAVMQSLELTQGQHWDEIAAVEKSLQMPRNGTSVAQQLATLMQQQLTGGHTSFTLSELLGLAILMFSLLGNRSYLEAKEEEELKVALVTLIQAQRQCDEEFIRSLRIDNKLSKVHLEQRVEQIMDSLNTLTDTRAELKQFSETYTRGVPPYQPLLTQVMEAIFNPARPDLPDLTHHSYGLADMLKSGFSLFMSSARPRPSNHPLLLLFVVGGVSCADVRHIRDVVTSNKPDMQVIILTTQLLTPAAVVHKVMCVDHLNP
eukprot:Em0016g1109a